MGDEIWLDPTLEEARSAQGSLVLATMPALETVTSIWQTGQMKTADAIKVLSCALCKRCPLTLKQCMDLCNEKCTEMHSVVAQVLLDSSQAK